MRFGLVSLAVGLLAVAILTHLGVRPGYRALAFIPFFFASYGVISALFGVCSFTAAMGQRMTKDGAERVANREDLSLQRKYAARVLCLTVGLAAAATSLFVVAS